ncbi:unnamed protein product [Pedinophyceae sp. YPF-701]|nr:unnamed protein product [Pedinophyceae sp. YPF-701]
MDMLGGFLPEQTGGEGQGTDAANARNDIPRPEHVGAAPDEYGFVDGHEDDGAGCSRCASLSYSQEYLNAFGVRLCATCKSEDGLLPKSTAREAYCLPASDLDKLGCIKKPNPRKKQWGFMVLLLKSQVEAAAVKRYGSLERCEDERRRRVQERVKKRMKKRTREDDGDEDEAKKIRAEEVLREAEEARREQYRPLRTTEQLREQGLDVEEI